MANNEKNETVNLLWTGGWDSTYRLIVLSRQDITVQPIYLYGDGRNSITHEREAQQAILKELKSHRDTVANILPLLEYDINQLGENIAISSAYRNITSTRKLGSQYEWLAKFAHEYGKCEVCVESPRTTGCSYMNDVIKSCGGEITSTNDIHRYAVEGRRRRRACVA